MHGLFKCDFDLNENPVQFWAIVLSFNQNTLIKIHSPFYTFTIFAKMPYHENQAQGQN